MVESIMTLLLGLEAVASAPGPPALPIIRILVTSMGHKNTAQILLHKMTLEDLLIFYYEANVLPCLVLSCPCLACEK